MEGGPVSLRSPFPSIILRKGLPSSLVLFSCRLFSHVGDPFLDDPLPREYVLYLRPTGPLAQKLSDFWQQSKQICGKNKAHNIFPHITLCQFFMVSLVPHPSPRCLGPGVQAEDSWESGRNSYGLPVMGGPSGNR